MSHFEGGGGGGAPLESKILYMYKIFFSNDQICPGFIHLKINNLIFSNNQLCPGLIHLTFHIYHGFIHLTNDQNMSYYEISLGFIHLKKSINP